MNLVGITRHTQISDAGKNQEAAEDLLTCVDAVMGVKASSTINSRGMVVKRYQFWCTEHDRTAWPMQETVAFDYVSHLKTLGAATAPASFLQAVNFMIYTIEPEGARSIIASYIIQGVAKAVDWQQEAPEAGPSAHGCHGSTPPYHPQEHF